MSIKTLEQGRAAFAYKCAEQNLQLQQFVHNQQNYTRHTVLIENFKAKFRKDIEDGRLTQDTLNNYLVNALQSLKNLQDKKKQNTLSKIEKKMLEYHEGLCSDYTSYVKKLPMLIKTNGLGAALAFYAGNKDTHRLIVEHILDWAKNSLIIHLIDFSQTNSAKDFAGKIVELDSTDYRNLTIEVMAFLNWLRRFSDTLTND